MTNRPASPRALPPRIGIPRLTGGAFIQIAEPAPNPTWFDVTCQVTSAQTIWGNGKPQGLLSQSAAAGFLSCEVYDPDRLLDPSNQNGQFYKILKPGLWVQLVYAEGANFTIVAFGRVDSIDHVISSQTGTIRANDWVSWFANEQFPNDVLGTLANWTSYTDAHSFARALIDRVNLMLGVDGLYLPVTVEPSPPQLIPITPIETPFVIGQPGPAIWQHFTEMVEEQLHYVWIDRANVLRFSNLRVGTTPGISIGVNGPLALDYASSIDASDIVNLVQTRIQDDYRQNRKSVDEWGMRVFGMKRDFPFGAWNPATSGEWLDLVLADRSVATLQNAPLQIWPATPDELRQLIAIEAMDLIHLEFDVPTPPIGLFARCMGGQISVTPEGWSVELVGWVVESTPILVFPDNYAVMGTQQPNFQWTTDHYTGGLTQLNALVIVQTSAGVDVGSQFVPGATQSYTWPTLLANGSYRWTVATETADGWGYSPPNRNFTVQV